MTSSKTALPRAVAVAAPSKPYRGKSHKFSPTLTTKPASMARLASFGRSAHHR
ncbi:MAG TPA: hypothetical protein VN699_16635 [Pirellulales bacterium]|nr:hypothetical protein [Pirellulales bacterium]